VTCGLIFDMDGLLLDTETLANQAWREAAHMHGLEIPAQLLERTIGRNAADTDRLLQSALPATLSIAELRNMRDNLMLANIQQHGIALKPGVIDVLERYPKLPKAIATSSSRSLTELKLNHAKLKHYFNFIITGDDAAPGKPDPAIYRAAIRALRLTPEGCLALEDSAAGITAASRAGLSVIAIPDLQALPLETQTACLAICNTITESTSIIDEWISRHAE
jgi:HAD superfamily hydrolase (TIGR01509 family)